MNPMLASANRVVSVTVEYDRSGTRVTKTFEGPRAVAASRAFYAAKLRANANPKVCGAARTGEQN